MNHNQETSVLHKIAGKWRFNEDFGMGSDTGYALLKVKDDQVVGKIKVTEQIEGDASFVVEHQIEGEVDGDSFRFRSVKSNILYSLEPIHYELDQWEGTFTEEGKIVGASIDDQGTCGVFVMERFPESESEL
ncbi:hypothetical protein K4L44_06245 [Halosquirtibacter laminarini]|uniref:Uncharacterized protein n=1 Tax=Halosquirtibacter laminarini TaxID=3374600 RepID=A0AC61NRA2_9BACT|nr:hypothetical protein K4L44_06245 [Prolixibacteraceae bacterium]